MAFVLISFLKMSRFFLRFIGNLILLVSYEISYLNGYMYLGCFQDIDPRDVNGYYEDNWGLTYQTGSSICKSRNFKYAAFQFG